MIRNDDGKVFIKTAENGLDANAQPLVSSQSYESVHDSSLMMQESGLPGSDIDITEQNISPVRKLNASTQASPEASLTASTHVPVDADINNQSGLRTRQNNVECDLREPSLLTSVSCRACENPDQNNQSLKETVSRIAAAHLNKGEQLHIAPVVYGELVEITPIIIDVKTVAAMLCCSISKVRSLYSLNDDGRDETFPPPVLFEGGGERKSRKVVWLYKEVVEYIYLQIKKARPEDLSINQTTASQKHKQFMSVDKSPKRPISKGKNYE